MTHACFLPTTVIVPACGFQPFISTSRHVDDCRLQTRQRSTTLLLFPPILQSSPKHCWPRKRSINWKGAQPARSKLYEGLSKDWVCGLAIPNALGEKGWIDAPWRKVAHQARSCLRASRNWINWARDHWYRTWKCMNNNVDRLKSPPTRRTSCTAFLTSNRVDPHLMIHVARLDSQIRYWLDRPNIRHPIKY